MIEPLSLERDGIIALTVRSNGSRNRPSRGKASSDCKHVVGGKASQGCASTHGFDRLVAIMARLRGPEGCPWDHEQTYASLRRYLLEESYEVAEAIDEGDPDALREELGDLLLQIVFLSQIAKEQGRFDVNDVAHGISEKLIRRHPHVFGSTVAETPDEVSRNWEEIKRREKGSQGKAGRSQLAGIPAALPAMGKARLLGDKAAQVGFDWSGPAEVIDKLEEEFEELREALNAGELEAVRDEFGDLLFSMVMLARKGGIDAEAALEGTNRKFRRRFVWIERELERSGVGLDSAGLELMERLWDQAKQETDDEDR
jgi:MazG family protein